MEESMSSLQALSSTLPFQTETDQFGIQTRPTCYFGDVACVFSYVGLRLQPKPWMPSSISKLRDLVETAIDKWVVGSSAPLSATEEEDAFIGDPSTTPNRLLTACLVNEYQAGSNAHIPWHYDEIRAHGPTKTVASLSLGGPRRFLLRKRPSSRDVASDNDDLLVADLMLPSGSVLLMTGNVQEHYEHCLPLDEAGYANNNNYYYYNNNTSPHRISLTFRSIVPGFEDQQDAIASDQCCVAQPS